MRIVGYCGEGSASTFETLVERGGCTWKGDPYGIMVRLIDIRVGNPGSDDVVMLR